MGEILDGPYRRWTIKLHVERHEPNLWCVTCPEIPLFHVVGETQEIARENVRILLKQYLELNYDVTVNKIDFADELGASQSAVLPAYTIAEVEGVGAQALCA